MKQLKRMLSVVLVVLLLITSIPVLNIDLFGFSANAWGGPAGYFDKFSGFSLSAGQSAEIEYDVGFYIFSQGEYVNAGQALVSASGRTDDTYATISSGSETEAIVGKESATVGSVGHGEGELDSIVISVYQGEVSFSGTVANVKFKSINGGSSNKSYVKVDPPEIDDDEYTRYVYNSVVEYETLKDVRATARFTGSHLEIGSNGYYYVDIANCTLKERARNTFAMIPTSTYSHVTAVHCNGYDALVETDGVSFALTGEPETDDKLININVYPDIEDVYKIQLIQDGSVLAENKTGEFSIERYKILPDKNLYVRLTDDQGLKYTKIKTNINTYDASDFAATSKGFNSIHIEIPEDVDVIGGMSFDIDLGALPMYACITRDALKIAIGDSQKVDLSALNSGDKDEINNVWDIWKENVEDFNNGFTDFMSFAEGSKKIVASDTLSEFAIPEINVEYCAYAEFSRKGNDIRPISSGGSLGISLSWGTEFQTAIYVVPVVIGIEGSIGADCSLDIGFDYDNKKIHPEFDAEITLPELKGSVGVGVVNIANISGYLSAENTIGISMTDNWVTGTLDGELGVSGKIFIFSGEEPIWEFKGWQYYAGELRKTSNTYGLRRSNTTIAQETEQYVDDLFDESSYSLDNRAYLSNQSQWNENNMITFNASNNFLIQSYIYDYANPNIVSTSYSDEGENTTVMLLEIDQKDREKGNQIAVGYSVYDSANNSWSTPVPIDDDGTYDTYADAFVYNDDIYAVYANANTTFNEESATIENMAESLEIVLAKFNRDDNKFEVINRITDDAYFNYLPSVCADENYAYVAYVENSNNDVIYQKGTNRIMLAKIDLAHNDVVSCNPIVTIKDIPITDLCVTLKDNEPIIAYIFDKDGDLQKTTNDLVFTLINEKGEIKYTDSGEGIKQSIRAGLIGDSEALMYYNSGNILISYDFETFNKVVSDDTMIVSTDYQLLDGTPTPMLLFKKADENGHINIFASCLVDGTWSKAVKVSNFENDKNIKYYSAFFDSNSETIGLAYVQNEMIGEFDEGTEDETYRKGKYSEKNDLYYLNVSLNSDLELSDVSYDDSVLKSGESLPVKVIVKNNGLVSVSTYDINITSDLGNIFTQKFEKKILPGETTTIEIEAPIPETITETFDYTFSVTTQDDVNNENDAHMITLGYADLSLDVEAHYSADNTGVTVFVENIGPVATDAKLMFRNENYESEILKSEPIFELKPGEIGVYHFNSDYLSEVYSRAESVCLDVVSTKEELRKGDNTDFFNTSSIITNSFEYEILDNDSIKITEYCGYEKDVIVPGVYDDYNVVAISDNVFSSSVETVIIPESVVEIGANAFESATNLKSIGVAEDNAVYLSENGMLFDKLQSALIRCPIGFELTNISLPNTTNIISKNAFKNCSKIEQVVVSGSVKTIDEYTFYGCASLKEITFPDGLEEIKKAAFAYCSALQNVNIPMDILKICQYAFYECNALEKITIGYSLTEIEDDVFYGCDNLTIRCYKRTLIYNYAKENKIDIEIIPEPATKITIDDQTILKGGEYVIFSIEPYYSSETLKFVVENKNVGTVTSEGVFTAKACGQTKITVTTQSGLTDYGTITVVGVENAEYTDFDYTSNGEYITIVGYTGSDKIVTIPETIAGLPVKAIESTFNGCSFEEITLSKNISLLSSNVFERNSNLNKIFVVEENENLTAVDGVLYSKDMTKLYKYPIAKTDESFTVPETVTEISTYAFSRNKSLKNIIFSEPKNIENMKLGDYAFSECTSLEMVYFNDYVETEIGTYTFNNCKKLVDFKLPKLTVSIGKKAFSGCTTIVEILIPSSIISADSAFMSSSVKTVVFEEGIENIPSNIFYQSNNLTSVSLAKSTKTIGAGAFRECSKLENITFTPNITDIYSNAFRSCSKLKSIVIPSNIKRIYPQAFYSCGSLAEVVFDTGIEALGYSAFRKTALVDVVIPNSVKTISMENYTDGEYTTNTSAYASAFSDISTLKSITFEEDVVSLSSYALYGCSSLEQINLPNSLEKISNSAFRKCKSLTKLYLSNKLTSIGSNAFNDSTITDIYYNGTEEEWNSIDINSTNSGLSFITIHFLHEHNVLEWTTTENATCSSVGSKRGVCVDCNFSCVETIPVLEHDMGDWYCTIKSSCTMLGEEKRDCLNCNYSETRDLAISEHINVSFIEQQDATCTDVGYTAGTYCSDCKTWIEGHEEIETLKHDLGEWYHTTKPTCTTTGEEKRDCSRCDHFETKISDKLEHSYSDKFTVDKEATCTVDGSKSRHCVNCDTKTDVTVIKAKGHKYTESVINPATCTTDGLIMYECSCGNAYTEVVPTHGHGDANGDGYCDYCDENLAGDNTCSCNCHKIGIASIIWKILRFFYKLFKINPVCECGASHY